MCLLLVCFPSSNRYTSFTPSEVLCDTSYNVTCINESRLSLTCPANVESFQNVTCSEGMVLCFIFKSFWGYFFGKHYDTGQILSRKDKPILVLS